MHIIFVLTYYNIPKETYKPLGTALRANSGVNLKNQRTQPIASKPTDRYQVHHGSQKWQTNGIIVRKKVMKSYKHVKISLTKVFKSLLRLLVRFRYSGDVSGSRLNRFELIRVSLRRNLCNSIPIRLRPTVVVYNAEHLLLNVHLQIII